MIKTTFYGEIKSTQETLLVFIEKLFTAMTERTFIVIQNDKVLDAMKSHFTQFQQIEECIKIVIEPALKQQESMKQIITEFQKALKKALEPAFLERERWKILVQEIELLKSSFPDPKPLTQLAEDYRKSIEDISPSFEQLQKSFTELPSRTQEALILLGEYGWYIDLNMPLPALWKLEEALLEGNVSQAEDSLVEYYDGMVNEIEKSILERFPKRQKVISAAFNAHRRQEYELSIPVFLAQTDGICKEMVNQYLFRKHNKKPCTAIYVEQISSGTFTDALLSPLAQTLPIGASEHERDKGFSNLNRHLILHGESVNYGVKTNSLKAISLINYVTLVLNP